MKLVFASSISATVTTIFVVVVTIFAELSEPFKEWLKSISGHHWTTKSIFTPLIYLAVLGIIYAVSKNPSRNKVRTSLNALIVASILGFLSILSFYIWHSV